MFNTTVSAVGYGIELIGVCVTIAGIVLASLRYLRKWRGLPDEQAYQTYRREFGRSIILGLEFLIAGDIIRTVVVANSLENVAVLGVIIVVRAFLSFTLHLEVEGRWPWQKGANQ